MREKGREREGKERREDMKSSLSSMSTKQTVGASSRMSTLHQRLYNALKLGHFIRCGDSRGQKWHCTAIETQKLVVRSIDAFLDCISSDSGSHQHPLVKDSVNDIAGALESILEFKNESVLKLASDLAVKMVQVLPSSLLESHVTYLVENLVSLLCTQQSQVSISCATALNSILSKLSTKREKQVWEILKERDSVAILLKNVKDSCVGDKPIEYPQEMAFLLSQIQWRWPPSRFSAWSDSKFLDALDDLIVKPEISLKAAVLHLYSSLALCGNGVKRLLGNGKSLLKVMVDCMNITHAHSIQMEGFRLAQCLMVNERGCVEVMKMCCEPLVNAIVNGMEIRHVTSGNLTKDQMSLVVEACRLALVTRWGGNHHTYFWKARVERVLFDLLLINFGKKRQSLHHASLAEQIVILQEGLGENFLYSLRPYIWDILGGLVANITEYICRNVHETTFELNILITCACLAFTESINTACHISQSTIGNTVGSESASRAVLMMVYSPCKYIVSQTRVTLSEILRLNGKDYIDYLLNILNAASCSNTYLVPYNFQVVISLISLACYASLPIYANRVIEHHGIRTLFFFLKGWFSNPTYIKRSSLAPHLHNSFSERVCCHQFAGEWEGEDMQLLFGLWGLAQLIHYLASHGDLSKIKAELDESQIFKELEDVCSNHSSPGSRWYAAYILSHFGLYGFPSKLGKMIGKAFMENELTDLELILTNLDSLHVHEVILSVRCPRLLPQKEKQLREKANGGSSLRQDIEISGRSRTEVRLSSHVDYQSLLKLMEYVYSGYVQAGEDILKKLKILAKHCDLQPLLDLLYRNNTRWGSPVPTFELTSALGPAGYCSSDVLLEADTIQLPQWRCSFCSGSVPHFHVHKIILVSTCDYLRAFFHSGMQESNLQTVKLPISWDSLSKLVPWLYSNELPKPIFDCLWNNLGVDQKLQELQSYTELCWLSEFWLLEDLHEECFRVVVSGLETDRYMSVELIQLAANFSQWKLAEIAATYMAPLYNQLRSNGDLDQLNENIVDMVRAASVQLSQEGIHHSQ